MNTNIRILYGGLIAYITPWSDKVLALLPLPLIIGYAIGDEIFRLRLAKFARGLDE